MMKPNNLKGILDDLEPFESEKEIKIVKDSVLEETLAALFEVYEKKLGFSFNTHMPSFAASSKFYQSCRKSIPSKHELTKKVVDEFVLRVVKYDDEWGFKHYTGFFINALIQTSFRQGNNNFELQLVSTEPINYLGAELRGWKDRRLALTIRNFAEYSKDVRSQPVAWLCDMAYVDATILGMNIVPPLLGIGSVDSTFTSDNRRIFDSIGHLGTFGNNKKFLVGHAGHQPEAKAEDEPADILQMRVATEA